MKPDSEVNPEIQPRNEMMTQPPANLWSEIAALYRRDLTRLEQQVDAFPDDEALWRTLPGVTNSAGNLAMHLEGNLREYLGRRLAGVDYVRNRPQEFVKAGLSRRELCLRIRALAQTIPAVLETLPPEHFAKPYPEEVFGKPITTGQFLIHLHGHFNWHLGQIDYLRRILTEGDALNLAQI
jgi:hypothetical protein